MKKWIEIEKRKPKSKQWCLVRWIIPENAETSVDKFNEKIGKSHKKEFNHLRDIVQYKYLKYRNPTKKQKKRQYKWTGCIGEGWEGFRIDLHKYVTHWIRVTKPLKKN